MGEEVKEQRTKETEGVVVLAEKMNERGRG